MDISREDIRSIEVTDSTVADPLTRLTYTVGTDSEESRRFKKALAGREHLWVEFAGNARWMLVVQVEDEASGLSTFTLESVAS